MGAGCHTQVSVPSLEHQNQFELWSIVQKSTCFHSVPTSLYKTASCSALYPTLVSVLFTAQLFSHVGHIEIDILYCLHLEKLPTRASTGSRAGWMVSPPGVEMSKVSTMSTWRADNSKSENRNPTNTAGKPRSPGQANTCRIPEIWLSLKFTCIEGRRLWRGGFRRWGNWCSPTKNIFQKESKILAMLPRIWKLTAALEASSRRLCPCFLTLALCSRRPQLYKASV